MSLKQKISEDMKNAMRSKESASLMTIRMLLAAIKQKEVDERIELNDAMVVTIVEKLIKQRRDSIAQFEAAGRTDLAERESKEIDLLTAYMPEPMSDAAIEQAVTEAIALSGAKNMQEMGKAMAMLKNNLAGRADMAKVSALLKAKLSN